MPARSRSGCHEASCTILVLLCCAPARGANEAALDALVVAYPDQLSRHDAERVHFKDGTSLPVLDGRPDKPFEEMTRHGSILDQFKIAYPKGAPAAPQGWCARFNRSLPPVQSW
ncbi:MAG: hypothetical protein JO273_19785 [Methylobacteriaceae bacterium]|nr:hypothetical protein [Methylobacteriaceae bacterium]